MSEIVKCVMQACALAFMSNMLLSSDCMSRKKGVQTYVTRYEAHVHNFLNDFALGL